MDRYEGKKYHTTIDGVMKTISKYGIAIIPKLLDSTETSEMIDSMWTYLETVSKNFEIPIDRNYKTTWIQFKELWPMYHMQMQHWKIGHAQFVWNLRQNPKVLEVFSKIWGVSPEELLVSFDGASVHMPPEITGIGWEQGIPKLHCDQRLSNNDFECIQSWVTANDINPGDATIAFYERSHTLHKEFAETFNYSMKKDDWHALNDSERDFYTKRCGKYKSITCPAGSMVLWDSRLIHCGQRPLASRPSMNIRLVVFLCYMKRSCITKANLEKKKKAFNEMRMTSHWPCKVKLFGKKPYTRGNPLEDIRDISPPVLSSIGRRLAGFD
jgi:hypothetical protein